MTEPAAGTKVEPEAGAAIGLRSAFVDRLLLHGMSRAVEAAARTVPRHIFTPTVSLTRAYSDTLVETRCDADGVAISSVSAPSIVVAMLDQLGARPGMRVLEVGSGGYNAALLAELVGPSGQVTTVDIDPAVVYDARVALDNAGYPQVAAVCGDGEYGWAPHAPYDRIIVTAGAWEPAAAWAEQLAPGGVLVMPLRIRGFTRSIAFSRRDQFWRSLSAFECGFIPMRGDGQVTERNIQLADDMVLRIDDDRDIDIGAARQAVASSGVVEWTGIDIDEPLDLLDYWLADLDGYCRLLASDSVTERGLAEPLNGWGSMATATGDALGYLTKRASTLNPALWELGVCAYGPAAATTVEQLMQRVRRWDRARRLMNGVTIEVHPAGRDRTAGDSAADALMTVDKRRSRIVVKPRR